VKIGNSVAGQWVVLNGLKPGEQVMVDGFQKLRGNAPVKAVAWNPAASGAASVASSGAASGAASGASSGAAPAPSAAAK
jgi:membrane fusion protein, multidrug efflux system